MIIRNNPFTRLDYYGGHTWFARLWFLQIEIMVPNFNFMGANEKPAFAEITIHFIHPLHGTIHENLLQ